MGSFALCSDPKRRLRPSGLVLERKSVGAQHKNAQGLGASGYGSGPRPAASQDPEGTGFLLEGATVQELRVLSSKKPESLK